MELVDKAKTTNDFGLRQKFPWTGCVERKPWITCVTSASERNFVQNLLQSVFRSENSSVFRVENPYLWARYMLSYEELSSNQLSTSTVKEHHVVHATAMHNALKIADSNFDWRLVNRARFGKGVSFSTRASYAQKYASGKDAYIIAGIPIAHKHIGHYGTNIPSACYDTTGDPRGNVYVKYYDNDFYPYYIVN